MTCYAYNLESIHIWHIDGKQNWLYIVILLINHKLDLGITVYNYLVGGFPPPLWKMMEWKSVGIMTFPSEWKFVKFIFQTTNQVWFWLGPRSSYGWSRWRLNKRPQTRSFAAEEPGGLYGTSLYKVLPGDPMQPTKNWSVSGPSTIHLSGGFNHFELGNIQLGYPVGQFLFYTLLNHPSWRLDKCRPMSMWTIIPIILRENQNTGSR